MRSKPLLFALFLVLLLAVTLRSSPRHMAAPPPGPAVRIIPPPAEQTETEPGEWVDIYTPDYDYAVQCGLQSLTVYWTGPEE